MGLDLVDFKRNNWGVTVAIIVVIMVLIFLPDFVGSNTSTIKLDEIQKNDEVAESHESENVEAVVANDNLPIGEKVAQKVVEATEVIKEKEDNAVKEEIQSNEKSDTDDDGNVKNKKGKKTLLDPNNVTWNQLHDKPVVTLLNEAKVGAVDLAEALPVRYSASKYALYNFINGINTVLASNEKKMTAKDAVSYLEFLDMETTRAFIRERVSRGNFMTWAQISLTPVFGRDNAETFKLMARPPYQPFFELRNVNVEVKRARKVSDAWDPRAVAILVADGIGNVDEVAKVDVYQNGKYIRSLKLKKDNENQELGSFGFKDKGVDGIYSFHISNKEGNTFVKKYKFERIFNIPKWKFDSNRASFVFKLISVKGKEDQAERALSLTVATRSKSQESDDFSAGDSDGFVGGASDNDGFDTY